MLPDTRRPGSPWAGFALVGVATRTNYVNAIFKKLEIKFDFSR